MVADCVTIEAVCDIRVSSPVKVTVTVSPTLAHSVSGLSDKIVTGFNVGCVLSKVTSVPSVVELVPSVGFPLESVSVPIWNGITPSVSPSCISYDADHRLLPRSEMIPFCVEIVADGV